LSDRWECGRGIRKLSPVFGNCTMPLKIESESGQNLSRI
jgi:hypothetical protein